MTSRTRKISFCPRKYRYNEYLITYFLSAFLPKIQSDRITKAEREKIGERAHHYWLSALSESFVGGLLVLCPSRFVTTVQID